MAETRPSATPRKRRNPLVLLLELGLVVVLGLLLYVVVSRYLRGEPTDDLSAVIGDAKDTLKQVGKLSTDSVARIESAIAEAKQRWEAKPEEERKSYVEGRLTRYDEQDRKFKESPKLSVESPADKDPEMTAGEAEYQKGRIALRQARETRNNDDYKRAEAHFRLALSHLEQAKDEERRGALQEEVAMLLYASMKEQTL